MYRLGGLQTRSFKEAQESEEKRLTAMSLKQESWLFPIKNAYFP